MTTNRTPIARPALAQITPRAIDLFVAMGKLKCSCPSPKPVKGPCAGCAAWYDLHDQLHRELAAEPWRWPVVGRQGPKRAGSPTINETIAATMALLDEAVRRRAAVPARKEEDTDAEPAGQDTST